VKFWKSEKFRKLEFEWNAELEKSGFIDVEKSIGETRVLKQSSDYAYRKGGAIESKQEYFILLVQCIHDEKEFSDIYDKAIMEFTALGYSIAAISKELRAMVPSNRQRGKFNRNTIRHVRHRYETKWGIRHWADWQMKPHKPPTRL